MKYKTFVGQIIKWEDHDKYFSLDKEGAEVDMLLVGLVIDKNKPKGILQKLLKFHKRRYPEITFGRGLPIFVTRPHDFKVGDIIETEINIKKVE